MEDLQQHDGHQDRKGGPLKPGEHYYYAEQPEELGCPLRQTSTSRSPSTTAGGPSHGRWDENSSVFSELVDDLLDEEQQSSAQQHLRLSSRSTASPASSGYMPIIKEAWQVIWHQVMRRPLAFGAELAHNPRNPTTQALSDHAASLLLSRRTARVAGRPLWLAARAVSQAERICGSWALTEARLRPSGRSWVRRYLLPTLELVRECSHDWAMTAEQLNAEEEGMHMHLTGGSGIILEQLQPAASGGPGCGWSSSGAPGGAAANGGLCPDDEQQSETGSLSSGAGLDDEQESSDEEGEAADTVAKLPFAASCGSLRVIRAGSGSLRRIERVANLPVVPSEDDLAASAATAAKKKPFKVVLEN